MINSRRLSYFLVVCQEGSITKASSRLRVAQPALTRQLQTLARDLGAALFRRDGRGITLTDAGRHLYERTHPLMTELRRVEREIKDRAGQAKPVVSLGIPSALSGLLANRLVERFERDQPRATLRIVDGWSGFLTDWVKGGELDLGIVYDHRLDRQSFAVTDLCIEDHYLVCASDDPMGDRAAIAMRELDALPLILPSPAHGLRQEAEAWFRQAGIQPHLVKEMDAAPAVKTLVQGGGVYGILSESDTRVDFPAGLRAARIVDPPLTRTLALIARRASPLSALADALKSLVLSEVSDVTTAGDWGRPLQA